MARVHEDGTVEGDPRWVVKDRADGANVNGWHWEERDVTNAARRLLTKTLTSTTLYDKDNVALRLLSFREGHGPEGEAVALNRRKKVGVFFDFTFTLEWHGEIVDEHGYGSADAQGSLRVEGADQDCLDDVPVEVELDGLKMAGTQRLLHLMRTEGAQRVRGLLKCFYNRLRAEYDPRAAEERRQRAAEEEERKREEEAKLDEELMREDEDMRADLTQAVMRDAGGDVLSPAEAREVEAAAILQREAEASRRRAEERERQREEDDEASRQRLEQAEMERRQERERLRVARAARPTPERTKKTDEELLDFITGDD
eukprot:Hpha_TRINITY_DN3066_c0_g1::TRINITY_DN3066_c0_g1_i1::g.138650::m.138650